MTLKAYQTKAPQALGSSLKRLKILYVEDEEMNWEVTMLHLSERYDIERARNSREAFTLLRDKSFHCVLMDIQLSNSDLDGLAITRALRGNAKTSLPDYAQGLVLPKMPIIFVTAYSARYSRQELQSLGGDELVTKPIDFTHLGLCISRCLLKTI